MKQKIKEALRQEYKTRLELDDEQLDGVAAFASTFVTDESKVEEFVKNDATLAMLRSYQRMLDRDRAKRKGNAETKEQSSDNGNQPNPELKPNGDEPPAWAQQLLEQNKAFAEKLTAFETAQSQKSALAALDKFCNEWDYAGGFPKERDEAKRIALKLYKAGGEKMTGEELVAAFREEFDPAVKNKGVMDFSKPFQSDGGAGGDDADFSAFDKAAEKLGWVEPK